MTEPRPLAELPPFSGLHLLVEFEACPDSPCLHRAEALQQAALAWVETAGLQAVGVCFHQFEPQGATGCVVLAESHLAIHTWPEHQRVTLDVFVCNFSQDNRAKAHHLVALAAAQLQPQWQQQQVLSRGQAGFVSKRESAPVVAQPPVPALWREPLAPGVSLVIEDAQLLAEEITAHQRLQVFESARFGRGYSLDGRLMLTEADAPAVHQALVHPVAVLGPPPQRALVLGGGDGASARELLRYPSMAHIDVVELDAAVPRMAQTWLPQVHAGAWHDARVHLQIEDARAFVARGHAAYDLLVLDLTDLHSAAADLYQPHFLAQCRALLQPQGRMSLQLCSPVYDAQAYHQTLQALHAAGWFVWLGHMNVPSFGGLWAYAYATLSAQHGPNLSDYPALFARRADTLGWDISHSVLSGLQFAATSALP